MVLHLSNTLTKTKAEITPSNPDGILRLYHCGPTVYGTPHLGNIRRFLVADLLVRTARFLGYRVRSVMNITDVGHLLDADHNAAGTDRMLVAAQREGKTPQQIAAKYTAEFFEALAAIRAEPADYYPRATMHIPQMQAIIQRLIEKGLAYETSSGVYFDVTKWPSYGKLSGNTLDAIRAGARVDVREEKHHPADFALWVKAPKEHLMQWDSPWGRGYPGWHIECSAMSMQLLGETIDVHTGGKDNVFPHHENEIAQSEGATGIPFVHTWLHNEFLELQDPSTGSGQEEKMSKSEGDILTINDVKARGYDPLAFRLLCLQTHYRSKLHFSWESMDAAASALKSLRDFVRRLGEVRDAATDNRQPVAGNGLAALEQRFTDALADDLGSPQALAAVFDFLREVNPKLQSGELGADDAEAIRVTFRKLDTVLALLDVDVPLPSPDVPAEVQKLVADREDARRRRDFAAADRLRSDIRAHGYTVDDTPQGPRVTQSSTAGGNRTARTS
ncbi:MAG: cysteinyl-tRNA synthetase [Parcubacteria group bacterium Gr01-1014_38]|nr:MAG: cysteinyl-tRNA synthetase [Parcubacteria group bacterium Gr01-1014_38]